MTSTLVDKLDAITDPAEPPEPVENTKMSSTLTKSNPSLNVTPHHTVHLDPDTPLPKLPPPPDHVLLHVKATGICGSDLHFWKDGGIGPLTVDDTYILGHEASGIVLECGSAVSNFKPGDRVAIEPGVSCGKCFVCLDGNYHLCTEQQFTGVYPYHGSLQRYLIHPAKWLHKMPDSMTFVQGSLLEPLSVVLHAIDEVNIKLGRGVAICGAGPIGLVSLACAKASGAWPVVITDVEPKRLRFAEEFVPGCKTYQVDRNKDPLGNATAIRAMFGSDEYSAPPVVLECTGIENSVTTACYLPRKKGMLMVIGVGHAMINNIPFMHLNMNEVSSQCH